MTLRELFWAAEGRARLEWGQTSTLLAMIRNVNRAKGTRAVKPNELNPFFDREKLTLESLSEVKGYFVDETQEQMDSGICTSGDGSFGTRQGTESEDAH